MDRAIGDVPQSTLTYISDTGYLRLIGLRNALRSLVQAELHCLKEINIIQLHQRYVMPGVSAPKTF